MRPHLWDTRLCADVVLARSPDGPRGDGGPLFSSARVEASVNARRWAISPTGIYSGDRNGDDGAEETAYMAPWNFSAGADGEIKRDPRLQRGVSSWRQHLTRSKLMRGVDPVTGHGSPS